MLAPFLPMLLVAQTAPPVAVPEAQDSPTMNWSALPDLPYRQPPQVTPAMTNYVRAQSRTRKCKLRRTVDGRPAIRVEVAVLIHPEDGVRTSVPRAIGCAPVEQYAAGLATGFARNNIAARTGAAEQWYRATLTFIWAK